MLRPKARDGGVLTVGLLGANGFVGTRIAQQWHGGEHELRPVVRRFSSLARLSRFDLDCRVTDVLDAAALSRELAGCEVVVNCITGDAETIRLGSETAYEAASRSGVRRLVHLSSASVHGQNPEAGVDEKTPIAEGQWHWYNNAKVAAEATLTRKRRQSSTELAILRPGVVWGPRSRWVTDFLEALLAGKAWVVDDGNGTLNSVFVDNLIHAIELCLSQPRADGEAFLIQDAESVRWKDLYQPLCLAAGHDWDDVANIPPQTQVRSAERSQVDRVKSSPVVRALAPKVGPRTKRLARAVLTAWREPVYPNSYRLPDRTGPSVTEEGLRLQSCAWRFPDTKARNLLGYEPQVSYERGLEITMAWLDWAGYPVTVER